MAGISHRHRKSIFININAVNKERGEPDVGLDNITYKKRDTPREKDLEWHLREIDTKGRKYRDLRTERENKANLQDAVRKKKNSESGVVDPF